MSSEKYVFFDIDGTIYDYDIGVIPSAKEAIRLLKENGHHPVLCTGRTRIMVFDEIMNLGFDGIIAGAGTYIQWQDKLLKREELDSSEITRLIKALRKYNFISYPEGHDIFYYDPEYIKNGDEAIYRIYQQRIPEHIHPINLEKPIYAAKVSAVYTKDSDVQKLLEEIGDDYYWADHSGVLFETIKKGCSKGKALKFLMDYLGADIEDTFAFGDSFNDLDMLQTAKYGILMGNAGEEMKKRIPLQTESMENDGVYNALKRYKLI